MRWNRPGRGLTQPGDFISLAEEAGFIVPIGNWVLGRACEQVASWQRAEPLDRTLGLHVPLAARQLQDAELVSTVADLLATTGLAAGGLVLEITESGLMQDPDAAAVQLRALRGLGVRLALDDFGTGYSSLAHLQQFPIQILKVDKAFVADMGKGQGPSSLARAIVQLGHTLSLVVVAEGVELPAQAEELHAVGCHLGQGYLWGRALPAQALRRWMDYQRTHPSRSLLLAAPAADCSSTNSALRGGGATVA